MMNPIPQREPGADEGESLREIVERLRAEGASAEAIRLRISQENDRLDVPLSAGEIDRVLWSAGVVVRGWHLAHIADSVPKPPRWIVRGLLEADSLCGLIGAPASGKSLLALALACHVATGLDFHGSPVDRGPALYLCGEGKQGIARRRRAWEIQTQRSLTVRDPLFESSGAISLAEPESAERVRLAVEAVAREHGAPKLLIVDTLARHLLGADENSNSDVGAVVAVLDSIRAEYGCAVLLVHHVGHGSQDRARGASALHGAFDSEWLMARGEDRLVRLSPLKMKDADFPEPMGFTLRPVELGINDDQGIPVTSAVLHPAEYVEPAKQGTAGRGRNQTVALQVLRELEADTRLRAEREGRDPATCRVLVHLWRSGCLKAGLDRRRIGEVIESLESAGSVVSEGDHVSSI
jgi:hypothetical protein